MIGSEEKLKDHQNHKTFSSGDRECQNFMASHLIVVEIFQQCENTIEKKQVLH